MEGKRKEGKEGGVREDRKKTGRRKIREGRKDRREEGRKGGRRQKDLLSHELPEKRSRPGAGEEGNTTPPPIAKLETGNMWSRKR